MKFGLTSFKVILAPGASPAFLSGGQKDEIIAVARIFCAKVTLEKEARRST